MAKTKNGIKYPDNYNSVADIPKDLKDMAESIDAQIANKVEKVDGKGLSTNDFTNTYKDKLDKLNNYDDTKIKQDIKDIKDEQKTQNEDISTLKAQKEELEKEVQSLKEDAKLNSLTEDNEGELVHIDNSTGARFNSLEIEGNEKQETREGYNLFDVLNATIQNQDKGVTITKNEDGSITANGTPTADWIVFIRDYGIGSKLEDGQTYSLWQENYAEEDMEGVYVQVVAKPNEGSSQTQKIYNASTIKKTFTVDKTNYNYQLVIQTGQISKAGTFENYKNRYMLYKGTDDKEFELYGAMPSFDYPSEVKVVGDNINLFSTEYFEDFSNNSGATYETIDDMIKVSTSSENQFSGIYLNTVRPNVIELNNKIKGKTVTYSFEAKADDNIDLSFGKSGNTKIRQVSKKWRKFFITYPNTSTSSIYFYNNSATITNFYIRNIKLEYGEKTSPYSTLGCGSIELKLCNKNILNIEKDSSIESNGLEITTDEYGTLTFNGTTMANLYVSLDLKYIGTLGANIEQKKFKKGTYVFSSENLTDIIDINLSAYIRQTAAGGEVIQYSSLYRPFGAKSKNAKFKLEEDVEAVAYLWIASGIKFDNAKIKFQIELGETATDIVAHEEQNYIIPVQQRMFSGDKFVKLDGQWKEMHTMGTVYSKDVSVGVGDATSGVDGFYRYSVNLGQLGRKGGSYIKILSNYFKYADSRWKTNEGICGWENGQIFCIGTYNKNFDTAEKLKTFLTENNVEIAYELAKPIYLDCTDEQIVVLDKIEQEAKTYEEVTNIYTEDEVGAIIKTNTAVDLKTVINNIQEQLIAE